MNIKHFSSFDQTKTAILIIEIQQCMVALIHKKIGEIPFLWGCS